MKKKKKKKKLAKALAHDLMSLTTICWRRTISSQKIKKQTNKQKAKQNCFQVSPFRTLHILICLCRLVQGWNGTRNTKKKKKREQRLGFGGLQGVKFKFVIPHVQVSIKMLQLVQLSCQQDRFGASQVPFSLLNKKGLGNWQDSLLDQWCNAVSTPCIFFSPTLHLSLSIHLCEGGASVGVCIITSRAKKRAPSFVSSFVAGESSLLYSETPFLTLFVPMTLAWVGHPICLFFL